MRWTVGLAVGLGLALLAGAAAACPSAYRCPPGHAYDGPSEPPPPPPPPSIPHADDQPRDARDLPPAPFSAGELYTEGAVWRDERGGLYMHGYRAAPCRCRDAGAISYERSEVSLSDGFFADAGGVGPVPSYGYYDYGGGYVIVGSGAHASASASARASVSIRYRGGFKGGGCCHGGGHKGGKRH